MDTTVSDTLAPADEDRQTLAKEKKYAFAAFVGTTIEWYDFYIYSTASALIFNTLFFAKDIDPIMGFLASFAAYGVGFFARPLGGIVGGHLGDRIGRKRVLVFSLLLMGVATTLTGLLPTYATAGIIAPVLLVVIRLLQGLATGAEWGGAALLSVENAAVHRRGFIGSFTQIGSAAGMLLASAVFLVVRSVLGNDEFLAWGWRIPFLLSIVLVVVGLVVRLKTEEAREFVAIQQTGKVKRYPVLYVLKHHRKSVLVTIGLRLAQPAMYAILTTYILSYLSLTRGDNSSVLAGVMIGSAAAIIASPLWARLSDRVGRKFPAAFALVGIGVGVWPFFYFLDHGNLALLPLLMVLFLGLFDAAIYSIGAAWFAEQFPTEVRYSGISLGYQVGTLISGGLTPFLATWLFKTGGGSWLICAYISLLCAISLVAVAAATDEVRKRRGQGAAETAASNPADAPLPAR